METENPRVFVVDDDEAVRESLCSLVKGIGLKVETFGNALQFLSGYNPSAGGCLLVDVRMPGMSGLELLAKLREWRIEIPAIVMTGHADVPTAVAAMKAGALDFIEKPFRHQVLLDSIQEALRLDAQIRRRHQDRQNMHSRLRLLTHREREVLDRLITGKTNKNTAYELGISQKTVDFHRANILDKVGVGSLFELVCLLQGEAMPWTPGCKALPQDDTPPSSFLAAEVVSDGLRESRPRCGAPANLCLCLENPGLSGTMMGDFPPASASYPGTDLCS
jgi:two-component system, LuxR family, response regulator FixJ